ncbi:regulatory protein, luxR family [Micromonospora pattaloongensis]|uniref:Regulatory protein, luxR family n=1 Tax=Micromonospora pattaloongensis TaxID=405436 RepID=A0A1H3LZT0_9ACTN|nr:helix-turn-helix transcriptional regulator [Micromonospora pattaloongensis]SDY69940.1 regulatory protein, luxR family [Micromonospora pattaloongensis]
MNDIVSEYEISILAMMAAGYSDTAIARRVSVSTRTLERHVARIMSRVGAKSRLGLGAIAAHHGWLDAARLLAVMDATRASAAEELAT